MQTSIYKFCSPLLSDFPTMVPWKHLRWIADMLKFIDMKYLSSWCSVSTPRPRMLVCPPPSHTTMLVSIGMLYISRTSFASLLRFCLLPLFIWHSSIQILAFPGHTMLFWTTVSFIKLTSLFETLTVLPPSY